MHLALPSSRPIICLVALAMLFSLAACFGPKLPTREEVTQQMLDHLQAKYDQSFEVYGVEWGKDFDGALLSGNQTGFLVYPTGGIPEDYFGVEVDTSTRPVSFHDSYVAKLMVPIYREKAQYIVSTALPGAIVRISHLGGGYPPDSFDKTTTFEEFKAYSDSKQDATFGVFYPMPAATTDEAMQAIMSRVKLDMQAVTSNGYMRFMGYTEQDFQERVAPVLNDPVKGRHGTPAGGFIKFEDVIEWKV